MSKWFNITIKATEVSPKGKSKRVTEQYLFDAINFTEAEARAIKEIKPYHEEFEVVKITPVKLSELFFNENGDRYFKCKVNYITLEEKSGKEKKTACYMYVQANNTKDAEAVLTEGMKGTLSDWNCEAIVETKIMDVYPFDLAEAADKLEDVPKEETKEESEVSE